jgi:hypothetical protein
MKEICKPAGTRIKLHLIRTLELIPKIDDQHTVDNDRYRLSESSPAPLLDQSNHSLKTNPLFVVGA